MPTWNKQPTSWGWFHILGVLIAMSFIFLGFYLGKKLKKDEHPKANKIILWSCSSFFLLFEIIKEIGLVVRNEFAYSELPFQICSLVIFAFPIRLLVKPGKVKDALVSFLSFFCVTGAFFYFVQPTTALNSPYILISLRSFLWHWMILFSCTFLSESYDIYRNFTFRFFLSGYLIWFSCLLIALLIDTLGYFYAPDLNLNFFYITYGTKPFYPILNLIFTTTEIGRKYYALYFIAFALYYGLGSYVIGWLFCFFHHCRNGFKKKT